MSRVDAFMMALGLFTFFYFLISIHDMWTHRPPVVWDTQVGRWRAKRGIHRQYGREHRHASLIK